MRFQYQLKLPLWFYLVFIFCGLISCSSRNLKPIYGFNNVLLQLSSGFREPSLSSKWLVALTNYQGKEKIEMIDILSKKRIPLPGINRADAQPISISISANGERLALIWQRADKTELLLYRRKVGSLQRIELNPKGIPRRVSLDNSGRVLAVQVSRDGIWDVEVIRLNR